MRCTNNLRILKIKLGKSSPAIFVWTSFDLGWRAGSNLQKKDLWRLINLGLIYRYREILWPNYEKWQSTKLTLLILIICLPHFRAHSATTSQAGWVGLTICLYFQKGHHWTSTTVKLWFTSTYELRKQPEVK
jgi:hypothetical protein